MKPLLIRLMRLDYLIRLKATGNPAKLGSKMGISERSVFDYLRLMKEMGAAISYSRNHCSYFYRDGARLFVGFTSTEVIQKLHPSRKHETGRLMPEKNLSKIS